MAEEQDPKLTQHYRSLEPLEPPPALDQAILAAARRAADRPHAPLVAPAGRHRWYYGLAAAAVLVLAVALSVHIERERPDPEAAAEPPPQLRLERELRGVIKQAPDTESKPAAKPAAPAAPAEAPAFTPDPKPNLLMERKLQEAPQTDELLIRGEDSNVSRPAAAMRAPATPPPSARTGVTRVEDNSAPRTAAAARRAQPEAEQHARREVSSAAPENPERWLERIAELRSRGKHAEADKELAEFRRVYPNYRLSEVMRERVEGR